MRKKESCVVSAVLIVAIAAVMFFPVTGIAGSLEPSAAPASTMKTLDQIPPTLSQKLPAAQRFELVLDGAAVLDRETGFVWEKTPSSAHFEMWGVALEYCALLEVGGRKGWHLPTIEQLASLVDTSVSGSTKLPTGHPFMNVQEGGYWSATSNFLNPSFAAYVVSFGNGGVSNCTKSGISYTWCVRGGQSYDGQ